MNKNKIAVVTGAGIGIGKAIAKRLSSEGFLVIVAEIDPIQARQTVEEIGKNHSRFIKCDISQETDVRSLFQVIMADYGRIDTLVNNAAIIQDQVIWKMSAEEFDQVIQVNLKGTWLMCRETAIIMKEQQSGRIINITSRGWLGNFGQTNYAASKGGVVSLTRVLALELGKYNILVNAVAPGAIQTNMTQSMTEEAREKLRLAQPTKTMGKPEDVAHMVAFLADERTQFITGQTLYVDGGKSIGAGGL